MYADITTINTTAGLLEVVKYANDITAGILFIMLTIAVWVIVTFAVYRTQQDFPMAVGVSGFVTAVVSTMWLIAGLINSVVYAFVVIIAVISVVWLWFTRD